MNVIDMVEHWLEIQGYEGLYYEDMCSCETSNLAPCGQIQGDCQPGYKLPCNCGDSCDFHIGPRKAGGAA